MTIEASTGSFYEIPDHAFRNSLVTEVTIPEGIEDIGKGAFKNCKELTKVTLPSTLETICTGAFEGCTSLRSIKFPEGVKTIQRNAFNVCTSLWNVRIPTSVEHIGPNAFRETALYKAEIPFGAEIDDNAFPKDNALYYTAETVVGTIELAKIKGAKVLIIAEGKTRIEGKIFQDSILKGIIPKYYEQVTLHKYTHLTALPHKPISERI